MLQCGEICIYMRDYIPVSISNSTKDNLKQLLNNLLYAFVVRMVKYGLKITNLDFSFLYTQKSHYIENGPSTAFQRNYKYHKSTLKFGYR